MILQSLFHQLQNSSTQKIYSFLHQASYMFRSFMAIVRDEFDKEYFPDDGRKERHLWKANCMVVYIFVSNYWVVFV